MAEAQRTVAAWKAIVVEKSRREEAAKAEAERIATEKAEAERKAAEERERAEKEEKARIEAEKKEAERIAAEKAEEEARVEAERKAEEERKTKEEERKERDENGQPFVVSSDGTTTFGEITEDTGLTVAPIKLSEGVADEKGNGYGLRHIEARHGDQIRKAGFSSVEEFIEQVAKNYDVIKEGSDRNGNKTYRLLLTDKHNNTLMIELSKDGSYWNVNTAGVFKKSYGKDKKEVYNRHTTVKQSAETAETSQADEHSGTQSTSRMNVPTTSADKGSEKPEKKQEKQSVFDKAKEIADKEEKKRKAEAEDDSVLGQATRAVGKKKKVNLFKYTASKIISYPALRGVHYANGYAYASDGYILFKEKADYPKDWEGTTRDKDGNLIDGKYPDTEKAIHRPVYIPDKEAVSLPSKEVLDFAIAASKKLKGEAIPVAIDGMFFNAVNLKKFLEAVASKGMDKVVYRHPMLYATNGKDEIIMMPIVNTLEGALDIADKMESVGLPKEQIDAWKAHIEAADKKMSLEDFKKAVENAKKEGVRHTEAEKPKEQPLTEAERKDAEEVAGALGYRVEWVDMMEENGTIDADRKVILIAKDAENPLVQVLGHEVAHGVKRMDGGKFKALQKAAMEVVGEKEWNERIEKKHKLNAYAEGKLAEEVTCDIVGEALNDKEALKRLAESLRGEKGILARLRDAVARMVEYFKNRGDKEGVRRMKAADKLLAEFESALKEGVAPEQVKPEGVDRSEREGKKDDKTLYGVHNISEDKLRKAMKLGGLANPSMAVVDKDKGTHEGFGAISLIAPSSLVDKQTGRTAGSWITDAYTQRYPFVERVMSDKGYKKFKSWVDGLDFAEKEKKEIMRQATDAMESDNDLAWELMYLREKGVDVKGYTSEVDYPWEKIVEEYPSVEDIIKAMDHNAELKETVTKLAKVEITVPIYKTVSADVRRRFKEETGENASPLNPIIRKRTHDIYNRDYAPKLLDENGMPKASDVRKVIGQMVEKYNATKKVDFNKSKSKASTYVHDNGLYADYLKWQEGKLEEFGTQGRIFRGYKNDGTRKYVPETLSNVSKAMKEESQGQTNGSEYTSFGSFIAKLAPRVDSKAEMRGSKSRLDADEAKQEFYEKRESTYYDLAKELYSDVFSGEARLHDIVLQSDPKRYAKKEYGITLSPSFLKRLEALKKAIREDLKSAYFETKFERPVMLNEFAAAVVPKGIGDDVRKGLEDAGLVLYEYDPAKKGDRERAANEASASDGIRFNRSEKTELTAEERELRDNLVERMRKGGLDVVTDSEEMQRVIDTENERTRMTGAKQKRALETATIAAEATNNATVISSADGAKIQNNLGTLATNYEKIANKTRGFITDLSQALGLKRHESSQYGTFETPDGKRITIRVSNHNARVSNFDKNNESEGISIVISSHKSKGLHNDGNAHIIEYFYPKRALENAEGKPLAEMIRSVSDALAGEEFKDTTGLAEREEVNAGSVREHRVYHGSGADFDAFDHSHMGEGEGAQAYGWGTYVTEVEGIGKTYAEQNATTHNDALRALQHDVDAISDQLNRHRDDLKYNEEQLKRANEWRAEAELDYELFRDEAEKLKEKYGEASPEYRNHLFNDIYTDEMKRAQNSVKSTEESIQYRKEKIAELEKALKDKQAEIDELPKEFPRHLYTVEIPDDNGSNYLDWNGHPAESLLKDVGSFLESEGFERVQDNPARYEKGESTVVLNPNATGADLYAELQEALGSDKKASQALAELGCIGIKYPADNMRGGRKDGAKNYVIFNENDAKITDHTRFLRTADGEVYGLVKDGRIYLDPKVATAETAVHEYTHLWGDMLRRKDSEQWSHTVKELKNSVLWEEVKESYPELKTDDEIADEVLSTFSGRRGAERLREEARRVADGEGGVFTKAKAIEALERVKEAIARFWEGVARMFGINRYRSVEELADMAMKDLLDSKNPMKDESGMRKRGEVGDEGVKSLKGEEALTALDSIFGENEGSAIPPKISSFAKFKNLFKKPVRTFLGELVQVKEEVWNKILRNNRQDITGTVLPTIENADFAIRDTDGSTLYVKRFKGDGQERMYNVVVVNKHGEVEDYISSVHIKRDNNLRNKIKKGAELFLPNARTTDGTMSRNNSTPGAKVANYSETAKPRYSRKPGESIFDYASRVSEDVDRSVRERVSARDEYEKKVKSKGFQTKEALQNSMLGLQEFMSAIDHASGNKRYIEDIPDFENPILGENRLSSVNKEEMHQVAKTQFKPLMSAVAKLSGNGKESGELYDYMFAKHGLERDAVMRQREAQKEFDKYQKANPKGTKTIGDFVASLEGKDYAGLTALTAEDGRVKSIQSQIDAIDEQMKATDDQLLLRNLGGQKKRLKVDLLNAARDAADDIRKAFESNPSHDRSDINELWSRVNEVNGNTLRKLYESGLLTKEAYNDISSMYTNYIPMRGFDQTTSADAYAYLTHGDSAFNAPIKTAKGRSSKADNPIAYMQAMAESAIMQGNLLKK